MSKGSANTGGIPLLESWWWFHPSHKDKWIAAAKHWETLRRAKFYAKLWNAHQKKIEALRRAVPASKPLAVAEWIVHHPFLQYRARLQQSVGDEFADLLLNKFDPVKIWLDFTPSQKRTFSGLVGAGSKFLLPRQSTVEDETKMELGLIDVSFDHQGQSSFGQHWKFGKAFQEILSDRGELRELGAEVHKLKGARSLVFLTILFDTTLNPEALARRLDKALVEQLAPSDLPDLIQEDEIKYVTTDWRPQPDPLHAGRRKGFLKNAESGNWAGIDRSMYPDLWFPQKDSTCRHPDPFVRVIPDAQYPFAWCLISAKHNIAAVRSRFHNIVRPENRRKWFPKCQAFWRKQVVTWTDSDGAIHNTVPEWSGKWVERYGGGKPTSRLFAPEYKFRTRRVYRSVPSKTTEGVAAWGMEYLGFGIAAHDSKQLSFADPKVTALCDCWQGFISSREGYRYSPVHVLSSLKQKFRTRLRELDEQFSALPRQLAQS